MTAKETQILLLTQAPSLSISYCASPKHGSMGSWLQNPVFKSMLIWILRTGFISWSSSFVYTNPCHMCLAQQPGWVQRSVTLPNNEAIRVIKLFISRFLLWLTMGKDWSCSYWMSGGKGHGNSEKEYWNRTPLTNLSRGPLKENSWVVPIWWAFNLKKKKKKDLPFPSVLKNLEGHKTGLSEK